MLGDSLTKTDFGNNLKLKFPENFLHHFYS